MALSFLGVFAAGLLTFVTPCVLPLVPIYLAAMVGGDIRSLSGIGRGQLVLRAAWFSLGFTLIFVGLGLGATAAGAFLIENKAALSAAGAVLVALFGLKFLGVIRIPWLDATWRADDRKLSAKRSWLSAFGMGLIFAAGWSPCVGPVLGSVLTYTAAATSEPLVGAAYLGMYGLGFALPLIGLAFFAEAGLRLMARLSRHLRAVEIALGVLLLVVAAGMATDALPALTGSAPAPAVAADTSVDPEAEPTLLAFTSSECAICQRMKPILNALVERCDGNKVTVRLVDVSRPANRPMVKAYHLIGVPTFVFADRDGTEVARLVGEQTEAGLTRALSALRGEPCPGLALLDETGGQVEPEPAPEQRACPPAPAGPQSQGDHTEAAPQPACQGV